MGKYIKGIFAALLIIVFHHNVRAQIIVTIAGSDIEGYGGDKNAAVSAKLHWPKSIAIGDSGSFFIADADNNSIRKVSPSGIITTIAGTAFEAGTGSGGYSGDGGAATLAQLYDPEGVAVDTAGNIYIADLVNNRVRKVDTAGIITTVAGIGSPGYSGDGAAATLAKLLMPSRVALDTIGNLYIVDQGNNCIRKVNLSGSISTIAGTGVPGYSGDGGAAATAQLNNPADIVADRKGNLYIADQLNECIRKIDATGTISTFAGINAAGFRGDKGAATLAMLYDPTGVAVDDSGNVYISDNGNARVRMVNDNGMITTIAGNGVPGFFGDNGPATAAELWFPQGLAVNKKGDLYIADQGNDRIRKINVATEIVRTLGKSATDMFVYPNPSRSVFMINVNSPVDEQTCIVITSLAGEKIKTIDARTNSTIPVDVGIGNGVPPGVYFISVVSAHGASDKKVVVY